MDVIDMHNHFVAPAVIDFLAREGKHFATRIVERDGRRFFLIHESAMRPIDGAISDASLRIADMDREGVTAQAISCVPFLMYPDVEADCGLAIAQVNNDAMAALASSDPAHFVPLASVPMQNPATAAKELERAAKLGLRGVEIPPKVVERQLDEADFEVFWEAAETLEMAVCIHPFEAAPTGALARYFLGNLVGNLYDTGLAAALLIYGGVLERHPKLKIVLYHGGGALPALVGRLDMGYRLVPECRNAIPRPPSTYVPQFHFDIIAHNRAMLGHLVSTYGAERFVVGSDYPLPAGLAHPVEEVKALGLSSADEEKILVANARKLLRLGN
ncbi:MAG: amidohydrolase family protein [Candidatus Binatus sp.]|uniref:amidohydrolase family protein n=1 Tax=Candidatus Binatus sp. TaxID=2811406 RepID=UPI0027237719|nr:amidohydrolase family protein [Candidatus Binatus sp.]MDO8431259.1 amidohydrolase family protein [Candidatus Binatus sp.]